MVKQRNTIEDEANYQPAGHTKKKQSELKEDTAEITEGAKERLFWRKIRRNRIYVEEKKEQRQWRKILMSKATTMCNSIIDEQRDQLLEKVWQISWEEVNEICSDYGRDG
ncbi:hypothetical protein PoB_006915700 [Plakobranchus ocellatus]|uniref:Uncharacterized protein n=1 Tax=Plakobranchus ocellatus TaxID=259542 RepID=A0AAV4DF62_9GAST|nr:hypothetical protein PoB_006915700 [Plakobranchus ocellatus]